MPKKRLTTNGNVFRRTDGRWQSVIWYFDEHGEKKRKVFSSKTKIEAQQKITNYIAQFNEEIRNSDEAQKTLKDIPSFLTCFVKGRMINTEAGCRCMCVV